MKISITQNHISRGRRYAPGCCPAALAIQEQTGNWSYIVRMPIDNVRGKVSLEIYIDENLWTYKDVFLIPPHIKQIIEHYDATGKMDPVEFELEEMT